MRCLGRGLKASFENGQFCVASRFLRKDREHTEVFCLTPIFIGFDGILDREVRFVFAFRLRAKGGVSQYLQTGTLGVASLHDQMLVKSMDAAENTTHFRPALLVVDMQEDFCPPVCSLEDG